ncbi:MAG: diaminopimelate epimerase [Pseudomonadota bacterium]
MKDRASSEPGLRFTKMHGLGNDFVLIDQRDCRIGLSKSLVRLIGDRHRGVGFDQLAEILPSDEADAELIFWNSDGSTAGACGNATRCIAHELMAESGWETLTLRTERGLLDCRRRTDGLVEVDMGAPMLDWRDVPLAKEVDTLHLPIEGDPASCSMGNPHCTFFVEDAEAVALSELGPRIENHPLFPERTNVQLLQILSQNHARMRVWERGVGITLASGSSSCAVVVNAVRRGLMERQVRLTLDGGEIEIIWNDDDHVLMAGPIAHAFEGILSPELIEAAG